MAASRCYNCNTFCSLEEGEPEVIDWNFCEDDGTLTGEVRLARLSECCGDELKEAFFSVDASFECDDCGDDVEEPRFEEVDEPEFMVCEKKYKSKRAFWLEAQITLKCTHCQRSMEYTIKTEEITAGEFEDC